eukprot:25865_1
MDINAECIIHKKKYKFTEQETLNIHLNMKSGILIFRNGKDVICEIKGINISKTYHFAVSLFQINDEICLIDYRVDALIIEENETYVLEQNMNQNMPSIFTSILIQKNGTLSVNGWNVNKLGGILNILCKGNIILEENAKIELNGKGYTGGDYEYSGHSWKGKSTKTTKPNFGGGGGGKGYKYGGGGGYGTKGQDGSNNLNSGGNTYGDKQL